MHMNVWTTEGTSTAQGWATGESIHTMAVLDHAAPAPVRRPTREPSSSAVRTGACASVTVAHGTGSGLSMHNLKYLARCPHPWVAGWLAEPGSRSLERGSNRGRGPPFISSMHLRSKWRLPARMHLAATGTARLAGAPCRAKGCMHLEKGLTRGKGHKNPLAGERRGVVHCKTCTINGRRPPLPAKSGGPSTPRSGRSPPTASYRYPRPGAAQSGPPRHCARPARARDRHAHPRAAPMRG